MPANSPARKRPALSPEETRAAHIKQGRRVGPVFVEAFNLAIAIIFEELSHPYNNPPAAAEGVAAVPLKMLDLARAIYVFNDSPTAAEALARGKEHFDKEAKALALNINAGDLRAISDAIAESFTNGIKAATGGKVEQA